MYTKVKEIDLDNELLSFDFYKDLLSIMSSEIDKKIYTKNCYFISNRNSMSQYKVNHDYIEIPIDFLNTSGFVVGKIIKKEISQEINEEIIKLLVSAELKWIKFFLENINRYLMLRMSNGKNILSYSNIQILFASCVLKIEEVSVILQSKSGLINSFHSYLPELIHSSCNDISKLSGGIGFLRGGSVEMLCTFYLINSIYFAEEV